MSDIRVTSTGRIFWKIDPAVAGLLCEAFPESFVSVERPAPVNPARPAQPEFSVVVLGVDRMAIKVKKPSGESLFFDGEPADAAGAFKGFEIPEKVLAEYALVKNAPMPSAGITDSERAKLPYGGNANTGHGLL